MQGKTHLITGVTGSYLLGYLIESNKWHIDEVVFSNSSNITIGNIALVTLLSGFISNLPDIDLANSGISKFIPFIGKFPSKLTSHRSITHSLFALLMISLLILTVSRSYEWTVILSISYLSHLLLDLPNKIGLRIFWPNKTRICLRWYKSDNLVMNTILIIIAIMTNSWIIYQLLGLKY